MRWVMKMSKVLDKRHIKMVKEKYEKSLLRLSNVVGVGIGYKMIKVYVKKKLPLAKLSRDEIIPQRLDGVETDVEEAGTLKAK